MLSFMRKIYKNKTKKTLFSYFQTFDRGGNMFTKNRLGLQTIMRPSKVDIKPFIFFLFFFFFVVVIER